MIGKALLPIGFARPFNHTGRVDKGPRDCASANLRDSVVRRYPEHKESPIDRFELGFGLYPRSGSGGRAMLNVDGGAHGDFALFAKREQRIESSYFHEADHVRSGINRRQSRIVVVQRVLVRNRLFCLAADANGNVFCHAQEFIKF
jgi:hypothetical protein